MQHDTKEELFTVDFVTEDQLTQHALSLLVSLIRKENNFPCYTLPLQSPP